jgi:uncharacterized integral membrane protein (TIGR00697 family)
MLDDNDKNKDRDLGAKPCYFAESALDWHPKYLDIVAVVFVTSLLASNLAAQKLFSFGPFTFTAGILIFPISYIFGDILTEVYGFRRAKRVIYMGLAANIFMTLALCLAIVLPPAPGWHLQDSFQKVHSLIPRIVIASSAGYLIGELVNSWILSRLKVSSGGKQLWVRINLSTIGGQLFDSVVFTLIAFAGLLSHNSLVNIALSAWIFKSSYEAISTPLTCVIVNKLKSAEGVDHFDIKDKVSMLELPFK